MYYPFSHPFQSHVFIHFYCLYSPLSTALSSGRSLIFWLQIRFFHWDCIEVLSMCPWWVVPVFWSPVMLAFLYCAYHNFLIQPRWPWLSSINGGEISKQVQTLQEMPLSRLFSLACIYWCHDSSCCFSRASSPIFGCNLNQVMVKSIQAPVSQWMDFSTADNFM